MLGPRSGSASFTRTRKGRQQDSRKYADDCDDDQQLDEGEAVRAPVHGGANAGLRFASGGRIGIPPPCAG